MIMGIYGDDKTCKTTLSLTFPKPLAYIEFDLGGFDRARGRFKKDIEAGLIKTHSFTMPMQLLLVRDTQGNFMAKQSRMVVGMKELWYRFLGQYAALVQAENLATIVIDTATMCWEICRLGYLQEKQEGQLLPNGQLPPGERIREKLLPIEYTEPNARMRSVYYAAKSYGKHLVLVHHSKDEFKTRTVVRPDGSIGTEDVRTGQKELSGWGYIGDMADIIVKTYIRDGLPYCKVELCGLCLSATSIEEPTPTYDKLVKIIDMMKGEA